MTPSETPEPPDVTALRHAVEPAAAARSHLQRNGRLRKVRIIGRLKMNTMDRDKRMRLRRSKRRKSQRRTLPTNNGLQCSHCLELRRPTSYGMNRDLPMLFLNRQAQIGLHYFPSPFTNRYGLLLLPG